MTAAGALHVKVTEHFSNELPARMIRLNGVNVLVNIEFMLPFLTQHVDFQYDICRVTRSSGLRMAQPAADGFLN